MVKALAGFFWLTIVFVAYLIVYPPGGILSSLSLPDIAFGTHLLIPVVDIVYFLAMAAAMRGVGMLLLRTILAHGSSSITALERELFALPLGAACLSLTVLGGNVVAVVAVWFYAVLIVGGSILNLVPGVRPSFSVNDARWFTPWRMAAAGVAVPPLLISMINALAPPTQYDSLVYHLAFPARYLADGGLHAVPYSIFSSFPQGMEMLFQAALAVRGPVVASLISWMFFPLTGLAIYAFCRRYLTVRLGLLAALVWLYTPMMMIISAGGYVDCALAFFVVMAVFAFLRWRDEDGDAGWLVVSGVLCGAACSIKYTALVVTAFCAAVTVRYAPQGKKVRTIIIFASASGLMFVPWLIKNAVLLYNPIAPWGTGLFTHSLVPAATARAYFAHIAGHGSAIASVSDWVLLPWHMTVNGVMFGGGFDIAGLLFLLFIPCILVVGPRLYSIVRNSIIIKDILLFLCLFCAAWVVSGKVLRFLVPVVPFLSIVAAAGFLAMVQAGRTFRIGATVVLGGVFAHNLLMAVMVMSYIDPARVVLGGESRREYLGRKVSYYHGAEAMKGILPPGAHVLYVGESRGFYYDGTHTVPSAHDDHPLVAAVNDAVDAADAAHRLTGAGYTHLFYSRAEAQRLGFESRMTAHGVSVWHEFMANSVRELYVDRYCGLYEIMHQQQPTRLDSR